MDRHRTVVIPHANNNHNRQPIDINTNATTTVTNGLPPSALEHSTAAKSVLKKANVIISTTFLNDAHPKVHKNALKPRPSSAASRISMPTRNSNHNNDQFKFVNIHSSNGYGTQQEYYQNEPVGRPSTAKAAFLHPHPPRAPTATNMMINNVTLQLNVPNKQPTLLERYWKYNKIKKSEVLTNRCLDSDDGRLYVLCTQSYLQNTPKLIRQRPKSGVRFSTAVTFSTVDESKILNIDSDSTSEESTSNYYYSSKNSIKSDKHDIMPMRSSLKSAQQKRRCVSATPRLVRNSTVASIIKNNSNNNEDHQEHQRSETVTFVENTKNNTNDSNHGSSINSPNREIKNENDNHSNSGSDNKDYTHIERDDTVDHEFDEKVSQLLQEKSNKENHASTHSGTKSSSVSSSNGSSDRNISSAQLHERPKIRPKSSISIASVATNDSSVSRKYYSVSQFNKFKNKLIDRRVYNQKQYENLDQVHNEWLHKPVPQDKKYIAGKYSVEMKRINYANYIKKRQLFLSESLCIKKLSVNV